MSKNTSFGGFLCTVLAVVVGCGAFFGLHQHFDKDDSSESEMSVESESNLSESVEGGEENSSDDEQQTDITDLNFYSNPDNFTEVEVVEGEKLAGNVYRSLKTPHDMDGDESNGFECYTFLSAENVPLCRFVSSSYENIVFGFSDTEWGESYPLDMWSIVKGRLENGSTAVDACVTIKGLDIIYNWVCTEFCSYVDIYFAPGSTFKLAGEIYAYTLNVDELTWMSVAGVTRLVAKTS